MLAKDKLKKKQYYKYLDNNVRLKKKKKAYLLLTWSLKGKLSSPLFRRENHWSYSLCVFVHYSALLSIKLTDWVSPYPFSESWEMRLATPCLISSFDNITFRSIKRYFFKRLFYSICSTFNVVMTIVFYEEIIVCFS